MAALPSKMRQIHFDGAGGPDVIRVGEADVPQPGPGKVLVEVAAFGINRPDCIQRQGLYPPPPGESTPSSVPWSANFSRVSSGMVLTVLGEASALMYR